MATPGPELPHDTGTPATTEPDASFTLEPTVAEPPGASTTLVDPTSTETAVEPGPV